MPDATPSDSAPPPPNPPPNQAAAQPSQPVPLTNTPAGAAESNAAAKPPVGGLWLNLLISASFIIFAFSGYWLYKGYRDSRMDAEQQKADAADRHGFDGGLGEPELHSAATAGLSFLQQRPEYAAEVGELLEPNKPFDYTASRTKALGGDNDWNFRITIRGAKSHAWYDTIQRRTGDHWDLLSAQLTVPDCQAADGRKVIHLLDPAPVGPPSPANQTRP